MDSLSVQVQEGTLNRITTMHEVLRERAAYHPEALAISFLSYDARGMRQQALTYAALDTRARAIAAALSEVHNPGDRALLMYDGGPGFVEAFFGCLYAGLIAVPVAPSRPRLQDRVADIARNCAARVLLHERPARIGASALEQVIPHAMVTADVPDGLADSYRAVSTGSGDPIAFLQYTSGSTGNPKGVIVTHRALLANLAQIQRAFCHDHTCVGVNWLPLHHDMGLIGTVLQPVYVGFPTYIMSPLTFVQHPERWLDAIGTFGGTTCGGPSFAYRHCVERVPAALARFDLHSWRVAYCGAEAIHGATLRRFAQAFEPAGFQAGTFLPCYGLAEATLFVTGARYATGATCREFDREALEQGRARPAVKKPTSYEGGNRELVSCGVCSAGSRTFVTDAHGHVLDDGLIGEVCVSGASLGAGYWANEDATRETFVTDAAGGGSVALLRTGDLGFIHDGELFITGRKKDLIIIDGRNIAPQDLECTAVSADETISGAAAVALDSDAGDEVLMLVEVRGRHARKRLEVIGNTVRREIAIAHGVPLGALVLVRSSSLVRTTSGKLARVHCHAAYREGTLDELLRWDPACGWSDGAMQLKPVAQQWLLKPAVREGEDAAWPGPALRLFCFPYAGGGAAMYVRWAAALPPTVDVCPVQLPGRENRYREAPVRSVAQLLACLEQLVCADTKRPFAFFGHSLGGRIAFELASHLRRRNLPGPVHLLLSGVRAPEAAPRTGVCHMMSDEAFAAYVAGFGALPALFDARPSLLLRALPLLRADFELSDALSSDSEAAPLDCPITVFGGTRDHLVSKDQMMAWHTRTTRAFCCEWFDGDHFFLADAHAELMPRIHRHLAPHIATPAASGWR